MRKKILEKRLARLTTKRDNLKARALASEDLAEVRAINAQLEELNEDIQDIKDEIEAIEADERETVPADAELRNGKLLGKFKAAEKRDSDEEDPTSTPEYRKAFKLYVQKGTPIEKRAGDTITTEDTGAAVPMTIMREVINTVRVRYGNLYARVRKLAVPGGVAFPVGALKAKFRWINESTTSPNQKLDKLGKVQFGYYEAEIRIAQSFLSSIVTLEAFEAAIVDVIAEAYLEAMDYGIVNGTGDEQMLGIVNDPRVTNVVTMTAAQISDWQAWKKNFFAKLPLGYRSGEFIFPVSTVDAYLETMADANGNPVFRQATGLEMNSGDATDLNGADGRFSGRDVVLVEPDVIPDFTDAHSGDVVGIYWQPKEYAINENFGFTMRRNFDESSNEYINKALVVVDGKALNPTGYVLIKKA